MRERDIETFGIIFNPEVYVFNYPDLRWWDHYIDVCLYNSSDPVQNGVPFNSLLRREGLYVNGNINYVSEAI